MRHLKKYIVHTVLGFMLLFLGILVWPSENAWAGDINGAEAGVIGAASGTFTYNGKTYRAYSSYINELYSYLARDGVDLSPAQAQTAINYIYSHVGTGVASGYVYEVGGEDDPNGPTEKETEAETETATQVSETTSEATTVTTETASVTETKTEREQKTTEKDTEVEDIFKQIEDNQTNKQQLNERVKPEDADAKAVIKEESIVIDTGDGDPIELESDKRIVPENWTVILTIVSIVTLVVSAVACLILILKKCMRFGKKDRKKPMHGHRRRRRIRKICRRILTVTTAVSVAGIFLILAIVIVVFNNSRILQSVQESGYFRYAYIEYLAENGKTEEDTTEISDSKNLSYDDFVIREKQATEQLLRGNKDVRYQQSNVAPYVRRLKEDLQFSLIVSGALFLLSFLLGCIFTIFMDLRRDRGIRMIAISELIGTVFAGGLTAALLCLNPARHLFIEPDYLYLFFKNQVDWMIRVLSMITVFGLVIGMSLIGVYFGKRKAKTV